MLPIHGQPCPFDARELTWLGAPSRLDRRYYYCPGCNVAFICWDDPGRTRAVVFPWNDEARLFPITDADRATLLAREADWPALHAEVMPHVLNYLQRHFAPGAPLMHCPNDGGRVTLFRVTPYGPASPARLYYCCYCQELHAFTKDRGDDWQHIATIHVDLATGSCQLRQPGSAAMELELLRRGVERYVRPLLSGSEGPG